MTQPQTYSSHFSCRISGFGAVMCILMRCRFFLGEMIYKKRNGLARGRDWEPNSGAVRLALAEDAQIPEPNEIQSASHFL